jgi:hypothetical protein
MHTRYQAPNRFNWRSIDHGPVVIAAKREASAMFVKEVRWKQLIPKLDIP